MLKISLSIIACILFSLTLNHFLPWQIDNKIITKIIIILSMMTGLVVAYVQYKPYCINNRNQKNIKRIKTKIFTMSLIWLMSIIFSYFLYNKFKQPLYDNYIFDNLFFSPIIILILYFWVNYWDTRQFQPNDDWVMWWNEFQISRNYWEKYKIFFLSNLIKIFFIPYIYGAVYIAITQMVFIDSILKNPWNFIQFLFYFGLSCDVMIALGGYIFSSKFLGTENISVDDTWQGWLVCLICYPPLLILYKFFTEQADSYIWTDWLAEDNPLYWVWAFLICITWCAYWLATVNFGFKFSNLSWRGLINTGLYKYMRHPAYFSKNVYWWLHTVPFFGVMGLDMLRNFLALSFVSLIYYLRAKTEEKHLLKFKEYQEYYDWIENNGLWAKIKKKFKIL